MKALTRLLPPQIRLRPHGGPFTVVLGLSLLGFEVFGRQAVSDVYDGLAGLALVAVAMLVAIRHQRLPLPWLTRLGGWLRRAGGWLAELRYEHGVDLRGSPPLPRKTPPIVGYVLLGLAVWMGLAVAIWVFFPHGWRDLGIHSLYTGYLALLLVLWATLLVVIFVGVYVPITVLDQWLRVWLGETDRRGADVAAVVGYIVSVSLIAWQVPPAAILVMCLSVAAGAGLAYWPAAGDGAAVLWRSRSGERIYAVPLRRVLAAATGIAALVVSNILLTACGGRLIGGEAAESMPVTGLLGAMAAWFMPGLLLVGASRLLVAWQHDPSRRGPPTVRLTGTASTAERNRAARQMALWGWRVRPGTKPREPGDVGVELVSPDRSEATEFDPHWPLKVSGADLEDGTVRSRFERRDEIQLRRLLFHGLSRLFKRAAPYKGPGGGGLLLAPHWWFIEGLCREDADASPDDSSAPKLVGPPYHHALPSRARQHIHQVLRATQVDMIFVEDGVGYKKVEKVLRVMLELYDVHGGRVKAEEMHFQGMPKVRVMIHDYEPGSPFESDVYAGPKVDDLNRVRMLHIFRDRGGHEELIEPPFDFSWTPAPAGVIG